MRSQMERKRRTVEFESGCKDLEETPKACERFVPQCNSCESSIKEVCPNYFEVRKQLSKKVHEENQKVMRQTQLLRDGLLRFDEVFFFQKKR